MKLQSGYEDNETAVVHSKLAHDSRHHLRQHSSDQRAKIPRRHWTYILQRMANVGSEERVLRPSKVDWSYLIRLDLFLAKRAIPVVGQLP